MKFPLKWADIINEEFVKRAYKVEAAIPGCLSAWQRVYSYVRDYTDKELEAQYRYVPRSTTGADYREYIRAIDEVDRFLKKQYYELVADGRNDIMNDWNLAKKGAESLAVKTMDEEWQNMYFRYHNVVDLDSENG